MKKIINAYFRNFFRGVQVDWVLISPTILSYLIELQILQPTTQHGNVVDYSFTIPEGWYWLRKNADEWVLCDECRNFRVSISLQIRPKSTIITVVVCSKYRYVLDTYRAPEFYRCTLYQKDRFLEYSMYYHSADEARSAAENRLEALHPHWNHPILSFIEN